MKLQYPATLALLGMIASGAVPSSTGERIPPTASPRAVVSLPLAFSEGELLSQSAVPVRLPIAKFLNGRGMPSVLALASAPQLSRSLVHLPTVNQYGEATFPLPKAFNEPGYFAMLTEASLSLDYRFPLISIRDYHHTEDGGIAFIGMPTRDVTLAKSHVTIDLRTGIRGYWYEGANFPGAPDSLSVLLVWQQGADTYAIWDEPGSLFSASPKPEYLLRKLANSMIGHVVKKVDSERITDRYLNNLGQTNTVAGLLVVQSLELAPPHTPGYRTRDHIAYKITRSATKVLAMPAPDFGKSPRNPFAALNQVLPALRRVKGIPLLLPTVTPYSEENAWPRLSYQVDASGYFVNMRLAEAPIPPNTPYAMSPFGLAGWKGSIAGGNLVNLANYGYVRSTGKLTAPTVSMAKFFQPSWVSNHAHSSHYRGYVILPNGVRALVLSVLAGDGEHTFVEFHFRGVPYGVGDYHNLDEAVRMAASMAPVVSSP